MLNARRTVSLTAFCFIGLGTLLAMASPPLERGAPAQELNLLTWEYLVANPCAHDFVAKRGETVAPMNEEFNKLGAEGWELVGFTSRAQRDDCVIAVFKRRK